MKYSGPERDEGLWQLEFAVVLAISVLTIIGVGIILLT